MKKLIRITALLLFAVTLVSCAPAPADTKTGTDASSESNIPMKAEPETDELVLASYGYSNTYFAPTTDDSGREMTCVSKYDFSSNGFGTVYNYDWASYTYALGYGKVREGDNDLYRISTCGGGLQPRMYAYAANGDDISSADRVNIYVDMTRLNDSSDGRFGLYLYLSDTARLSDSNAAAAAPVKLKEGGVGYIYDTNVGVWKKVSVRSEKIDLGDGFVGYVSFPLGSFEHFQESGRKYLGSKLSVSGMFSSGYRYLCRVWTFFDIKDTYESQSYIMLDDLSFTRTGASHAHVYERVESVPASCTEGGYELFGCTSCSAKLKKDPTTAVGHSFGENKLSADGTVCHVCSACSFVEETDGESRYDRDPSILSVTFDHAAAGGKKKALFLKGDVISLEDIEQKMTYTDKYVYQFNCWTSDEDNIVPSDPLGTKVEQSTTYYARYAVANYTDKYKGFVSVIAQNGGAYYWEEGKCVVLGNSNMSLYHGLESAFASAGIPAYNNSVAGSTSYEMLEYYKALVLTYKPRVIVANVTTNDMAYYNVSDLQILDNMAKLHEMTKALLPDAYLLFVSGNPLPGRTEYSEQIVRVNAMVKEYSEHFEECGYVNVYDKVLAYANKYPTSWDTWTHLDQAGLADMFSLIKDHIVRWCAKNNVSFRKS